MNSDEERRRSKGLESGSDTEHESKSKFEPGSLMSKATVGRQIEPVAKEKEEIILNSKSEVKNLESVPFDDDDVNNEVFLVVNVTRIFTILTVDFI